MFYFISCVVVVLSTFDLSSFMDVWFAFVLSTFGLLSACYDMMLFIVLLQHFFFLCETD